VKQIKDGEYKNKKCRCGAKATWRANKPPGAMYSCDAHMREITEKEREHALRDDNMSEADYQTWGRL